MRSLKVDNQNIVFPACLRKLIAGLLIAMFFSTILNAQDFIYKHYGDPIYGKVVEIEKWKVRFQKQTYFDSAIYTVPKHRVVKIVYADSTEVVLRKSRWTKAYRPAIYFTMGGHLTGIRGDATEFPNALGIGHKGVFDLPFKNLGISYSTDFIVGNYAYYPDIPDPNADNYPSDNIYSAFVYLGLEYRHIYFSGFALCGGAQIGYNQLTIPDQELRYGSKWPNYATYIGAEITFIEFGIRYTGGKQIRIESPGEETIDRISKEEFAMNFIQAYWAVKF